MIKGVIAGMVLTLILGAGGVFYYFSSGSAPVAVDDPPMPLEAKLANMALDAHIERQGKAKPSVAADEANLAAGAKVYRENCAVCHGMPGEPKTAIAEGMFPAPPQLFHGKGVTDDPPGESYWKVKNGIRLTGMPGFKKRLSETQMWQVSQLVANADKITPAVKAELAPAPAAAVPATAPPAAPLKK